jgi:hypothetical protein
MLLVFSPPTGRLLVTKKHPGDFKPNLTTNEKSEVSIIGIHVVAQVDFTAMMLACIRTRLTRLSGRWFEGHRRGRDGGVMSQLIILLNEAICTIRHCLLHN